MFFPCSLSQNPLLLASPGKLPNFISVLLFSLFLYFYSRLRTIVSLKTPFFLSFLHSHSLFGHFLDTWLMKGYWIFAVQPEPIITFFFFLFFFGIFPSWLLLNPIFTLFTGLEPLSFLDLFYLIIFVSVFFFFLLFKWTFCFTSWKMLSSFGMVSSSQKSHLNLI